MGDIDNAYKKIFSHAEMVRDLLRGFVREEWVERLDFSTLEKVSGGFVTDDFRDRESDIIWRLRWGEAWLYVYILLEFQSTVDRFMAVRIGGYVHLLYQDLIKSGGVGPAEKLPPVLPLVLYNGVAEWTAATEVNELIAEAPAGLDRFQPRMRYLLLDERRYADAELASLNNLAAAMFRLEKSRGPEDMRRVVCELVVWLQSPEQAGLHEAFTTWINRVLLPRRLRGIRIPEMSDLWEVNTMLTETVPIWTQEWKAQGMAIGEAKGEEKGVRKGEEKALLNQLKYRFGEESSSYREKIANADSATLEMWTLRVLEARSLEDVFRE